MISTRTFGSSPAAVKQARRFVGSVLDDLSSEQLDPIVLMVSELASNCVRHAGTEFSVTVERSDTGVRIEVADHGGGVPHPRSPGPLEPSGRGLLIIVALCDDWGSTTFDGRAKTVWFVKHLRPEEGRRPSIAAP